jgi:hypothetical protein
VSEVVPGSPCRLSICMKQMVLSLLVLGAAVSAQVQAPLSAGLPLSPFRLSQDHSGKEVPHFCPLKLGDGFAKFACSKVDPMKAAASGLHSYDMTKTGETPWRCYTEQYSVTEYPPLLSTHALCSARCRCRSFWHVFTFTWTEIFTLIQTTQASFGAQIPWMQLSYSAATCITLPVSGSSS